MPAKIFINYRRDDVPGDARSIREALAARFGKANVFMDVDNLLAGQRFDIELDKALAQCGVLIAVMGPRWMDQLTARARSGDRDYVREEIAVALRRGITVIPVRAGREGAMAPVPQPDALPADIRDLVLHQKQDVAHERFGRDIAQLIEAIDVIQNGGRTPRRWGRIAAGFAAVLVAAGLGFALSGGPWPGRPSNVESAQPAPIPASPPDQPQLNAEIGAKNRQLVVAALSAEDFAKGLRGDWRGEIACAGGTRFDFKLKAPGMAPGSVSMDAVGTRVLDADPNRDAAIIQVNPGFVFNFFAAGVEAWPAGYTSREMTFQLFTDRTRSIEVLLNEDQSFFVLDDKSGLLCGSEGPSAGRTRFIRTTQ